MSFVSFPKLNALISASPLIGKSPLSVVWGKYNVLLLTEPILTKSLTSAVLSFAGDLVCQYLTRPPSIPYEESWITQQKNKISWRRTFSFTLISFLIFAPLSHYWYGFLSTKIVGDSFLCALQRVILDQFLYAPIVISCILAGTLLFEGKTDQILNKLRQDLLPTLITNYLIWIPAQLINFSVVPEKFRVLWANAVGFFWGIYLSYAANKPALVTSPPTSLMERKEDYAGDQLHHYHEGKKYMAI
jgi:uncharacterized membrane protein (DUF485 family)